MRVGVEPRHVDDDRREVARQRHRERRRVEAARLDVVLRHDRELADPRVERGFRLRDRRVREDGEPVLRDEADVEPAQDEVVDDVPHLALGVTELLADLLGREESPVVRRRRIADRVGVGLDRRVVRVGQADRDVEDVLRVERPDLARALEHREEFPDLPELGLRGPLHPEDQERGRDE
jgi:hypothetical protein